MYVLRKRVINEIHVSGDNLYCLTVNINQYEHQCHVAAGQKIISLNPCFTIH